MASRSILQQLTYTPQTDSHTHPSPDTHIHHTLPGSQLPTRPSAFLPSPTAARLPAANQHPSGVLGPRLAAASPPPSNAAAAAAAPASPSARLCRNCKQYYEPSENHDRACRYHTKSYTGDTKRKGDWSANADRVRSVAGVWRKGGLQELVVGGFMPDPWSFHPSLMATYTHTPQFENERQWWCCGEPSLDAPGCKYDRHRSYDDE